MKKKNQFTNFIKGGLTVLISVLIIFTVVKATTVKITPPIGEPTATFYSLSEIYDFIASNTTATVGSPALDFSDALEDTGRTLTEIYDALVSKISANQVKKDTIYLGVTGTLVPSGGTAATTDILSGKTFFGDSQTDWTLQTGTFDPWTPQWLQTKDDWVNSEGTSGEYILEEAVWTTVTGSPFSGYNSINYDTGVGIIDLYSGEVKKDERTGLWWSDIAAQDGGGIATTTTNSFTTIPDGSRPTNGRAINFCNALNTASFAGYNNWYLPTQKELMQAYIDGSANNLVRPGDPSGYTFWSSTEYSGDSGYAFRVLLHSGAVVVLPKTNSYNVRCVRR